MTPTSRGYLAKARSRYRKAVGSAGRPKGKKRKAVEERLAQEVASYCSCSSSWDFPPSSAAAPESSETLLYSCLNFWGSTCASDLLVLPHSQVNPQKLCFSCLNGS
ncbi:hypothetical protein B296_00022533 [Ensete ventricosum]|uniref:Uncharacterized protein n=1 Tax=Ensete ventricosum TaxID=4639 RepID=A0A426ZXS5_ENSVE|nr:hypothetical protein B296_00022533 [Ensete ventricosum]